MSNDAPDSARTDGGVTQEATAPSGNGGGAFGRVSRTKGIVFEYLTLAASLAGILSLGVLLIYVSIDAFGLRAADPLWYLLSVVFVVVPTVAFTALGYLPDDRFGPLAIDRAISRVALGSLGRLAGGLVGGFALVIVFVVFDTQLWFLFYTLAVIPAVASLAYARLYEDARGTLAAMPIFVAGGLLAGYLKGPISTFPTHWLIYLWTLAIPAAVYVGLTEAEERRGRLVVGVGTLSTVAILSLLAGFVGVNRWFGIMFAITLVVPTALYYRHVLEAGRGRLGLLAPVAIGGGMVVSKALIERFGVAQPNSWLDWQFLTSNPSSFPEKAGLYPAIVGSVFVIVLVAILSFVVGVATAVYLEEYAPQHGRLGTITRFIQVNISNLAGVPSVVYGLLGLGLFVSFFDSTIIPSGSSSFGTVVVASLTLSLLILPIVVISAQEAIRSVPSDLRRASYGMGATRWQTVRDVVLPESLPGILTGTILALGRAIGEAAPLIMIGAPNTVFSAPTELFARVSAMPMQIYAWAALPQEEFRYGVVAAGVVTLVLVMLAMNSIAIVLRNKYQRD